MKKSRMAKKEQHLKQKEYSRNLVLVIKNFEGKKMDKWINNSNSLPHKKIQAHAKMLNKKDYLVHLFNVNTI